MTSSFSLRSRFFLPHWQDSLPYRHDYLPYWPVSLPYYQDSLPYCHDFILLGFFTLLSGSFTLLHRLLKYPDVQLFFTVKLAKAENVNSYNFFLVTCFLLQKWRKFFWATENIKFDFIGTGAGGVWPAAMAAVEICSTCLMNKSHISLYFFGWRICIFHDSLLHKVEFIYIAWLLASKIILGRFQAHFSQGKPFFD